MNRNACPVCQSESIHKAGKAERKLVAADTYSDIRRCQSCGHVFERPWAAWVVWFCLFCGWTVVAALVLLAVTMIPTGQWSVFAKIAPPMSVVGIVLPSAYRQRRLRRQLAARPARRFL